MLLQMLLQLLSWPMRSLLSCLCKHTDFPPKSFALSICICYPNKLFDQNVCLVFYAQSTAVF